MPVAVQWVKENDKKVGAWGEAQPPEGEGRQEELRSLEVEVEHRPHALAGKIWGIGSFRPPGHRRKLAVQLCQPPAR